VGFSFCLTLRVHLSACAPQNWSLGMNSLSPLVLGMKGEA